MIGSFILSSPDGGGDAMKVFLDSQGRYYLAESRKSSSDAERVSVAPDIIDALKKAVRPVTLDELQEYRHMLRVNPELAKDNGSK